VVFCFQVDLLPQKSNLHLLCLCIFLYWCHYILWNKSMSNLLMINTSNFAIIGTARSYFFLEVILLLSIHKVVFICFNFITKEKKKTFWIIFPLLYFLFIFQTIVTSLSMCSVLKLFFRDKKWFFFSFCCQPDIRMFKIYRLIIKTWCWFFLNFGIFCLYNFKCAKQT